MKRSATKMMILAATLTLSSAVCCGAAPHKKTTTTKAKSMAVYIPSQQPQTSLTGTDLTMSIHARPLWAGEEASPVGIEGAGYQRSQLALPGIQPAKPNMLEKITGLHIDNNGDVPPLGDRPSPWNGLQTTIPNAVPNGTVGISFGHF